MLAVVHTVTERPERQAYLNQYIVPKLSGLREVKVHQDPWRGIYQAVIDSNKYQAKEGECRAYFEDDVIIPGDGSLFAGM